MDAKKIPTSLIIILKYMRTGSTLYGYRIGSHCSDHLKGGSFKNKCPFGTISKRFVSSLSDRGLIELKYTGLSDWSYNLTPKGIEMVDSIPLELTHNYKFLNQ